MMTPALDRHYEPRNFSDRIAYAFVVLLRFFADTFFARRYGHRAVVLETVAAVPLYLISPTIAHRVVGYLEEEAVHSYTEYLAGVDNGTHANVPAPRIAIDYWKLAPDAQLHDVIVAVRADEIRHREVHHGLADLLG